MTDDKTAPRAQTPAQPPVQRPTWQERVKQAEKARPKAAMPEKDRARLAELRNMLPPKPQHRTPEEEKEMRALEHKEADLRESDWDAQDARVAELQESDHRTPEEEDELARLLRVIDDQHRSEKRMADAAMMLAEANGRPNQSA